MYIIVIIIIKIGLPRNICRCVTIFVRQIWVARFYWLYRYYVYVDVKESLYTIIVFELVTSEHLFIILYFYRYYYL